ncbi:MAG: protein translocase subunit SecD [Ignavibacteria bacterium]|nr:protein translocase subunit SecD [Ignavibacteria bacterium]
MRGDRFATSVGFRYGESSVRKQASKLILIASAVILSLYFLYPTYRDYQYRKEVTSLSGQDSLNYVEENRGKMLEAKLKRLKLGLDLQGGMRVVLEVDIVRLLTDLARNKDDNFRSIIDEVRSRVGASDEEVITVFAGKFSERGIRLSRYYGTIRDDDATIISFLEDESEKAVDRAVEIVRNRVDQYGASEPTIQKQGGRRIIVELPGVKDEAEVRQLLQGTAKLEFRMLRDPEVAYRVMESIDKFLAGGMQADTTKASSPKESPDKQSQETLRQLLGEGVASPTDTTEEARFSREHPFFTYVRPDQRGSGEGYVEEKDREWVRTLLAQPGVQRLIPTDFEFLWSAKTFQAQDGKKYFTLFAVKKTPELTGGVIVGARASVDPEDNRPIVNMEMNSEGSREWARITGANVNKRVAIALDNGIFSAPVIQTKIVGGKSRITGMDSPNEARLLEIVLKAGALPAPVEIMEQRTVGPSLGEDSIRSGLTATAFAFVLTVFFMLIYYRTAGTVANVALFFNILFILGVLSGFQATLTLPGIAGIILTIGMAVDANVLIYERVREELEGGKTLKAAIDNGYSKAFSAIIDSNITTFLTGLILFQFGTGPVQGFALTLMIGILASLFSAIIITRMIFNFMYDKGMTPKFV